MDFYLIFEYNVTRYIYLSVWELIYKYEKLGYVQFMHQKLDGYNLNLEYSVYLLC